MLVEERKAEVENVRMTKGIEEVGVEATWRR